jgi:hypothetical protein
MRRAQSHAGRVDGEQLSCKREGYCGYSDDGEYWGECFFEFFSIFFHECVVILPVVIFSDPACTEKSPKDTNWGSEALARIRPDPVIHRWFQRQLHAPEEYNPRSAHLEAGNGCPVVEFTLGQVAENGEL